MLAFQSGVEQGVASASETGQWWRGITPLLVAGLCLVIIGFTFAQGLRKGMDHKTTFGPESEQREIAIALSESVYGLHLGYIGFASVLDKLVQVWNRGANSTHDPILIQNGSNKKLINEALTEASSLGPQKIGYVGDRSLITAVYDDVGYIDYVRLSFALFGRKIGAIYFTFFALLTISSAIFILVFQKDVDALVILLCTLLAFLIEIQTAIFTPDMPTLTGMRHSSTLALIPMWFFICLLVHRRRPTLPVVLAALAQVALLMLAIRIRGSAVWGVLLVVGITVYFGILEWRRQYYPRSIKAVFRSSCWWPAAVVVGGVIGNNLYLDAALHPVYFTDDVIPYHGLWHTAVLGLSSDPKLYSEDGRKALATAPSPDSLGYVEALDYLDKTHFLEKPKNGDAPIGYISPWTGTIKFRLHDNIMRRVFFHILERYPVEVAWVYLHDKPIAIINTVRDIFHRTKTDNWFLISLAGGLLFGLTAHVSGMSFRQMWTMAPFMIAAYFVSALPNLWAYPAFHTMADNLLTLLTGLTFLMTMLVLLVANSVWQVVFHRKALARPSSVVP